MIIDAHPHLFAPDAMHYSLADPTAEYRPLTDGSVDLLRAIIDAFGPERCLYGSNLPTAQYNPNITYRQAVDPTADERRWILGQTAARLGRWSEQTTDGGAPI